MASYVIIHDKPYIVMQQMHSSLNTCVCEYKCLEKERLTYCELTIASSCWTPVRLVLEAMMKE